MTDVRRWIAGPCAVLLLCAGLAASAAADPLAVLAAIKGRVQVARGSATARAAGFGSALERGDRVIVPAGGSATVFFNDGNVVELAEKSSITIGGQVASKPRLGPGGELSSEVYSNVSRFVTGGSAQTGLVAMARVRGTDTSTPILLAPRNTGVLASRPSFSWRAVEGATRYRLAISDDQGARWSRETTALALDYPADAESLAAGGEYLCELEALSDHGSLRTESSSFEVLRAADAGAVLASLERIRATAGAESPAGHFLAGSYLFGHRLYDDAARHFQALARLSPESSAPHNALGKVYQDQGLMDLAAEEFHRAYSLASTP